MLILKLGTTFPEKRQIGVLYSLMITFPKDDSQVLCGKIGEKLGDDFHLKRTEKEFIN